MVRNEDGIKVAGTLKPAPNHAHKPSNHRTANTAHHHCHVDYGQGLLRSRMHAWPVEGLLPAFRAHPPYQRDRIGWRIAAAVQTPHQPPHPATGRYGKPTTWSVNANRAGDLTLAIHRKKRRNRRSPCRYPPPRYSQKKHWYMKPDARCNGLHRIFLKWNTA